MIENPRKYPNAMFLSRFLAGIIDFGLVIFLSVFTTLFVYAAVEKSGGKATQATNAYTLHVDSSRLADNEQKSYTVDRYFEERDGNSLIISSLSYFYTVYLAGDEAKVPEGYVVSLNANKEIEIDGVKTIPKNLYTVEWFNTKVLQLPTGEQVAKYDYFEYQKNELNENDYTKIGVVSSKYLVDGKVNATDELVNYIFEEYKKAADLLFGQDYMVEYQNTIDKTQATITLIARLSYVLIFYEIIPLCLARGKSLGKLCMKLSVVKVDEEPIKRWQVIPRGMIYLLVPLLLYFVNNIIVQLIVVGALLISMIVLYIVDKKTRRILHDYIANTIVVEDINKM